MHPSTSDCPGTVSQWLKDCDKPIHMRVFLKSHILFIFYLLFISTSGQKTPQCLKWTAYPAVFFMGLLTCWICFTLCLAMLVLVDHLRALPYSQFVLALHWRAANPTSCCHHFSCWHTLEPSCYKSTWFVSQGSQLWKFDVWLTLSSFVAPVNISSSSWYWFNTSIPGHKYKPKVNYVD